MKAKVGHVDLNGFDPGVQFPLHHECEPLGMNRFIGIVRLIQSHGQSRPRSASRSKIDPDSRVLLVFKVLLQLCPGGLGQFDHAHPPASIGCTPDTLQISNCQTAHGSMAEAEVGSRFLDCIEQYSFVMFKWQSIPCQYIVKQVSR